MTNERRARYLAFTQTALYRLLREAPIAYFDARLEGAEGIPREGPALLVGNHALLGLDGVVLGALVGRDVGRHLRFLGERNLWRVPLLRDLIEAAGAIPGEPDAAVELLRAGELVCVYPGGADDSFKTTPALRHRLQWGQRTGFARVAMRAGAPILPVAGLGIDDMFDVVAREQVLGRRLFGAPRYDLPLFRGALGLPWPIPRRVQQRYRVLAAIDTSGDADSPEDAWRVREATREALQTALLGDEA